MNAWTLGQGYDTARNHAICDGHCIIAEVRGNGYPTGKGWSPESEAIARLICAAPDMLDALQYAYDRLGIADVEAWERIARAIAKATGKP